MKVYVRFFFVLVTLLPKTEELFANERDSSRSTRNTAAKEVPVKASASSISLSEYLDSVRKANQALQISTVTIEASELRGDSSDIVFSPQFFSQASHTSDAKEQVSPLSPDKIEATNITFGIQKLWESGLQTQVSYSMTRVQLDQPALPSTYTFALPIPNAQAPGGSVLVPVSIANPALGLLPADEYTEAKTQIDVVHPLWKNAEGREAKLTRESVKTKIEMQKLAETYKAKNILAQAENVYWQLALMDEAIRNQEGTIERLRKIRAWAGRRADSQLGDRVDFLQADSGLKAKLFELEMTKKDRNALRRTFNTMRGIEGSGGEGREKLETLSGQELLRRSVSEEGRVKRLDIEIARRAERISEIEVEQSREKFKGQLDVFGSVALNAMDKSPEEAAVNSFGTKNPTYVVGVRFSTPLDHEIINRDRQGLIQTSTAQRLDREYKEFTAKQDWDDLQAQLSEAEERLRLALDMEKAQATKVSYERGRLDNGRTTTYQILTFENDYAQAQLAAIRVKAEILSIQAKLKSFGDTL